MSTNQIPTDTINQIRDFNRFYTRHLGLLDEHFLGKQYRLPEIRVLYEVARGRTTTATKLAQYLRMDPGYVSRILAKLLKQGLLERAADPTDRRRKHLTITKVGREWLQKLDGLARQNLEQLLSPLTPDQHDSMVNAMTRIRDLLEPEKKPSVVIRPLRLGDIGTIIHRHAILYAAEYGWDQSFEKSVLEVLSGFISHCDPDCERGWVAEVNGEFAGSVFAVKEDETTARLRALLVEPRFRGMRIGKQLIDQCVDFCRQCGYKKMTLWTCSDLTQARKLYSKAGFTCTRAWKETPFGTKVTSECWDMNLPANQETR